MICLSYLYLVEVKVVPNDGLDVISTGTMEGVDGLRRDSLAPYERTSAQIGALKCNFPTMWEIMTNRPTDSPDHREVALPITLLDLCAFYPFALGSIRLSRGRNR